jgi:hypothetical protein
MRTIKPAFLATLAGAVACIASCSQGQQYTLYKLPSGKEIKVTLIAKMDSISGDPALVMNYLTDVSIDNKVPLRNEVLRNEVDEIWNVFQKDVESAKLKVGIIRATHIEGSGFIKSGQGYGFVFVKRNDGKWHCLDDDKQTK